MSDENDDAASADEPRQAETAATESAVVPSAADDAVLSTQAALAVQHEAEIRLARSGVVGAVIGGVVGALIWMGLVALSLAIADTSINTWAMLGMGAGVGVFAGVFYGGWAGTLYGNTNLERAESASEAEEHAHH